MKILLLFVLLVLTGPALAIDTCYTGSWASPNVNEGINVEVLEEDRVLVYWYTYRFFDRAEQNWLLFVGDPDQLEAYDVLPLAIEGDPDEYRVGVGSITPIDENTLLFAHDLELELDQVDRDWTPGTGTPWCMDERCAGVLTLKRLTRLIECE